MATGTVEASTTSQRERSRLTAGLVDRWWRVRRRAARVPRAAGLLAVFGYLASDTPSLLPRPWYFQGLIAGISAVIFYGVGVVLDDVWRAFARWAGLRVHIRPHARRVLTGLWLTLLVVGALVYPLFNRTWHDDVTRFVGQPTPGPFYPLLSAVTALVVLAVFVGLFRLVSMLIDWVTSRVERTVVRQAVAKVLATVVTLLVLTAVVDQVVVRGLLLAAKQQADAANAETPSGLVAPTSPLRSGGPGSLVAWPQLGADGSSFIASGPDRDTIAAVTGVAAQQPIRIFAPIADGRTQEQTRDLVLAEMDRTGAFQRKAVLVVTSTSTGFVNEWSAEAFEYLQGGDTAIVTMQYSTLPSALALITSRDQPPRVGRLLFDAVAARVAALPAGQRPGLYAGGESLGAYGGNGAFTSGADMLSRLDGALWTGTPSFTPLQEALTDSRAYGSTAVNPVVDGGRHIRFAGSPRELTKDQFGHDLGSWEAPRVAYLQHDSDPVVWWSPDLLFATPAWLDEAGPPGTPMNEMSWLPVVTFWQVTADMAMSNSVPGGYGHRYYETETVPAWASILGLPVGADYARVESAIRAANRD